MARGFQVSGDHAGQTSNGLRWPYGAVAIITPFNFPLEIPALQLMGALFMGNKPLVHVDHRYACYPVAATVAIISSKIALLVSPFLLSSSANIIRRLYLQMT